MNDLFNLIGLLGVPEHEGRAFFLDSIPGISSDLAAKVSKTPDFDAFYDGLLVVAKQKFQSSLQGQLSKCGFVYSLMNAPNAEMSTEQISISTAQKAVSILSGATYGKYAVIELKGFSFVAKEACSAVLKVYDNNGFTPVQKHTQSFAVVAGLNTPAISPVVRLSAAFAPIDLSFELEFDADQTLLGLEIFEADGLDLFVTGYTKTGSTLFLSDAPTIHIDAEVVFDMNLIVSEFKSQLTYAAACLVSAMILDEKASSYKLNAFTQKNTADSLTRAESLMMEFEKSLKDYAPTIKLKLDRTAISPAMQDSPGYSFGSIVS